MTAKAKTDKQDQGAQAKDEAEKQDEMAKDQGAGEAKGQDMRFTGDQGAPPKDEAEKQDEMAKDQGAGEAKGQDIPLGEGKLASIVLHHLAQECRNRPEVRAVKAVDVIEVTADRFAMAILAHPRAEAFLGGNPIDGGKYNGQTRGEYLADRCFGLAADFQARLGTLCKTRTEELAEQYRAEDEAKEAEQAKQLEATAK
ncbi:MAG: hypothetical protein CVV05_15390 [Gammaproteobacteria bacterium HGW-Gammaproteobacteria-1]|jgi:hypothetical protein|nr:MAG: hypothetical protein CVV05_15390 [Gammaproteobacteria bacterium HGW-Gammaproteobacteria-1]